MNTVDKEEVLKVAVVSVSDSWHHLKALTESFGETLDMRDLLRLGIELWEYYYAVPDEFPNKLKQVAEDYVNYVGAITAKTLAVLITIDPDERAKAVRDIYNGLASKLRTSEPILDSARAMAKIMHQVVRLLDAELPETFKADLEQNRGVIIKSNFFVVGKTITAVLIIEQNRLLPKDRTTSLDEDYVNRRMVKEMETEPENNADPRMEIARLRAKARKKQLIKAQG